MVLEVKGIGCPVCFIPAKQKILRIDGVLGVHSRPGGKLIVIYDPY